MEHTAPPDQQAYYEQVWYLVRQVPYGQVANYGQIAQMIPPPVGVGIQDYLAFSPRWVGGAMAACPAFCLRKNQFQKTVFQSSFILTIVQPPCLPASRSFSAAAV